MAGFEIAQQIVDHGFLVLMLNGDELPIRPPLRVPPRPSVLESGDHERCRTMGELSLPSARSLMDVATNNLRAVHGVVGLVSVVAFILTGQYMHHVHDHLQGMADGPRLLYRTAHIYLLFSGLLNVALGSYMSPIQGRVGKALQLVGSAMVLVAPMLLLVSFLTESESHALHRPIARAAIYGSLGGIAMHFLASRVFSGDEMNPDDPARREEESP